MADAILTRREVRALTGSTVPAEQVAWLNARQIRHFGPNLAGLVVVPRSSIDGQPATASAPWSPDFTRLTSA